ncbi:hypothetical protein [Caldimonas tepidiphila]|uniref:hypothetical protein n=1 Tax=Caldimonas tepidiphila TaxID=2315841 RepID=UPI001473724C|nr:hypothetical protein [Caldimonas tepidiphila]
MARQPYRSMAGPVFDPNGPSMQLFTALIERDPSVPIHLTTAAYLDGMYCLDAPELLPAGGCRSIAFGKTSMPEQLVARRT